jgi:hypothetical protein
MDAMTPEDHCSGSADGLALFRRVKDLVGEAAPNVAVRASKRRRPLTAAPISLDVEPERDYTLNLNSTTSPSRITYSLPSMRTRPAARAATIDPAATRSS